MAKKEIPKYDVGIASRFKEFCKEELGSQVAVAEYFGKAQSVISKVFRGIYPVHTEYIKKLSKEKDLNPSWVYDNVLPKKKKDTGKKGLMINVNELRDQNLTLEEQVKYLTKLVIKLVDRVNELEKKI